MERLVITIRPSHPDDGMLTVADAMLQVLDAIRLFERADAALAEPSQTIDWRLEKASTNSPFTVTAIAVGRNKGVDISQHATAVKRTVSSAIYDLVNNNQPAWWMDPDTIDIARALFTRNLNGIGSTEIAIFPDNTIAIDRDKAEAGIKAIGAYDALSVAEEIGKRTAWGEIEGVMVAAGRHRKRPSIQIYTELYGYVWCILSEELISKFGGEHQMSEVWTGKSVGVRGTLTYGDGGKLLLIGAQQIRELSHDSPVDLESVMDPDFTSGLDPVEYVRRLHEGTLA